MSREDQYSVTVSLDGVSLGIFDKMSGGDIDSEETKYKQGAMQGEIVIGGSRTVTNITLSRLYDFDVDNANKSTLIAAVGRGDVVVTKQPLDVDGNTYGTSTVYNGKLKQVTFPDHDSNSSAAGIIEFEVSCATIPA